MQKHYVKKIYLKTIAELLYLGKKCTTYGYIPYLVCVHINHWSVYIVLHATSDYAHITCLCMQVAQSCNLVYLDGSETKGSGSVSVIAKYGRHTQFLFFRVWVPNIPLDIELSDSKLSQIKGWKTPKHQRR